MRTIHSLSSSGGTVFAKAIAALPHVVVLSEMNPKSAGRFSPYDPVSQFLYFYRHMVPDMDHGDIFVERVEFVRQQAQKHGAKVVVRDHSHPDFLDDKTREPGLRSTLARAYDLKSLATVRHPVDAWLSMQKSGWHRGVSGFTEYCARVEMFVDAYSDIPLLRYEDFVADPEAVIEKAASILDLEYAAEFKERMLTITMTGDSGRARGKTKVKTLKRRQMPEGLAAELATPSVQRLLARLGYDR